MGEKQEEKKFRETITFGSTKSQKLISKTLSNIIYSITTLFYYFMEKKIDVSREEKRRQGAGNQKYTPVIAYYRIPLISARGAYKIKE